MIFSAVGTCAAPAAQSPRLLQLEHVIETAECPCLAPKLPIERKSGFLPSSLRRGPAERHEISLVVSRAIMSVTDAMARERLRGAAGFRRLTRCRCLECQSHDHARAGHECGV